jgi:hypothetical protein
LTSEATRSKIGGRFAIVPAMSRRAKSSSITATARPAACRLRPGMRSQIAIELIQTWIAQGGNGEPLSCVPRRAPLPDRDRTWVRNEIDAFVRRLTRKSSSGSRGQSRRSIRRSSRPDWIARPPPKWTRFWPIIAQRPGS